MYPETPRYTAENLSWMQRKQIDWAVFKQIASIDDALVIMSSSLMEAHHAVECLHAQIADLKAEIAELRNRS